MTQAKPLVEDEDFIVITKSAAVQTLDGVKNTPKIWKVWLANSGDEVFLCAKCMTYTHTNSGSVVAHQASHTKQRNSISDADKLKVEAFSLLPAKIRTKLLAQARKNRQS